MSTTSPTKIAIICLVAVALCVSVTRACQPGWFRSSVTNLCYKSLIDERLSFSEAQRKCNSLRSNLFQYQPGDTKAVFDNLMQELYSTRNTSEFKEIAWVGLTDRAVIEDYVFLNGFKLNQIAPDTLISCPNSVPNCKRTHRCVYFNLNNRGISNRQIFNGDCENTRLPPMCYAPVGGTDRFDQIPALGAGSSTGLTSLTVASLMAVLATKLLM